MYEPQGWSSLAMEIFLYAAKPLSIFTTTLFCKLCAKPSENTSPVFLLPYTVEKARESAFLYTSLNKKPQTNKKQNKKIQIPFPHPTFCFLLQKITIVFSFLLFHIQVSDTFIHLHNNTSCIIGPLTSSSMNMICNWALKNSA